MSIEFIYQLITFRNLQEMVIDEVGSDRFPRYLVYDIVRFEGLEVGRTDFSTRLTCIEKEIVGARNSYIIAVRLYLHCLL